MGNCSPFMVVVCIFFMILHSTSAARRDNLGTQLNFVPAIRHDQLTETACFTPDTDGMFVAVPQGLFNSGAACNKTLRISCAEPYRDLGGPWPACKTERSFTVTVIDQVLYEPLDDDLFHLSQKAFSKLARPEADSIRLIIH